MNETINIPCAKADVNGARCIVLKAYNVTGYSEAVLMRKCVLIVYNGGVDRI